MSTASPIRSSVQLMRRPRPHESGIPSPSRSSPGLRQASIPSGIPSASQSRGAMPGARGSARRPGAAARGTASTRSGCASTTVSAVGVGQHCTLSTASSERGAAPEGDQTTNSTTPSPVPGAETTMRPERRPSACGMRNARGPCGVVSTTAASSLPQRHQDASKATVVNAAPGPPSQRMRVNRTEGLAPGAGVSARSPRSARWRRRRSAPGGSGRFMPSTRRGRSASSESATTCQPRGPRSKSPLTMPARATTAAPARTAVTAKIAAPGDRIVRRVPRVMARV